MQRFAPSGQKSKLQSAGLAVTGAGVAIALLYYGRAFCITVVVSVLLAFLLEPFVSVFIRFRMPRAFASLLVCTIALLFLYSVGALFVAQIANLADDLPVYSQRVNAVVDSVANQLGSLEQKAYKLLVPRRFQQQEEPAQQPAKAPAKRTRRAQQAPPDPPPVQEVRIREERPPLLYYLAGYVSSVYETLLMISFVPFLVYFMLSWREHVQRQLLAIYVVEHEKASAARSLQAIASMARAYVAGNVILGLLISLVSCLIFWSWNLEYWLLLGFVSGYLSLIPYVGMPLAILPPLAGALMTYTAITPFVVIAVQIAILHLLALNLLYPAIVGARVHLNPLAVTIALMFWGTIWGGIGLVLAIPITAAVKAVLENNEDLQPWGRLLGD